MPKSAMPENLMHVHPMRRLEEEKGFAFKQDGEHGYRRVVASPKPTRIVETAAIKVSYLHSALPSSANGLLPLNNRGFAVGSPSNLPPTLQNFVRRRLRP